MVRWAVAALLVVMLAAGGARAGDFDDTLPRVNGRHGIGLSVGAPTGLTLEEIFARRWAFDLAGGRNLFQGGRYYAHADLIYTVTEPRFVIVWLPIYVGLGGEVVGGVDDVADDVRGGVRVPLGIQAASPLQSFQLFLEVAGRLDVRPDVAFHFDASLGFRYFL